MMNPSSQAAQQQPFALPITSRMTSATGLIALLNQPSNVVKAQVIKALNEVVNYFWPEISDASDKIELLAADETFEQRHLALLLLSKINFHLSKYEKSVEFALKSGHAFNIEEKSEFVTTILAAIIDKYTWERVNKSSSTMPADLENIFERVLQRCLRDQQYKQIIGMALDCRRLDVLEAAVKAAGSVEEATELLYYAQEISSVLLNCVDFRRQVTLCIIDLFEKLPKKDNVFLCNCYISVQNYIRVAEIISALAGNEESFSEALQIAFNTFADGNQEFLAQVQSQLKISDAAKASLLKSVFNGQISSKLYLEFLCRNNSADNLILERSKAALNPQISLHHQAISAANSYMHAGTTNDEFLRKNLEFFSFANNWAKFSATAGLGSIHKGQCERSRELLAEYFNGNSQYSQGGALFALGLINVNQGALSDVFPFLFEKIQASPQTENEALLHGACLGLGSAGLGSQDASAVEALKAILYSDNAVAGEAAAVSIGLVQLGSGNGEVVAELLQYARETQHEKIIRGLALGAALVMYGKQDEANGLIEQLESENDPVLRYGSVWSIAMAYAGTSSNYAIRKLLHFAVSDANDDVRRAAVTALGFILFQNAEELPRLVELLTESYNPHVRYGAALALGIAFAGTASRTAIDLILPMCKDLTDFVRQGAFLSLSMILMQHNEKSSDQVGPLRRLLEQVVSARHEDQLAKYGAVLAQGILDAGGRNVRISLKTPSGHLNVEAITGLALFCQFWYWYPFAHFLPLAFQPTALIAVNSNLQVPKFSIICHAKQSLFAYPEPTKANVVVAQQKIVTAVLSTTAKAAARAKKLAPSESKMSIDEKPSTPSPMQVDAAVDEVKPTPSPVLPESNFFSVENLTRLLPTQIPVIQFPMDSRYVPTSKAAAWNGGIIVVKDLRPKEPVELIEFSDKKAEKEAEAVKAAEAEVKNEQPTAAAPAVEEAAEIQSSAEMKD